MNQWPPHAQPTVVLVSQDHLIAEAKTALEAEGFVALLTRYQNQVERTLDTAWPCVVVLDDSLPLPIETAIYDMVARRHHVPTLVLVPPRDYSQLTLNPERRLLEEYIARPFSAAELPFRVKALLTRAGLPLPESGTVATADEAPEQRRGKVTGVFGLKGGVGKSVIAANLAVGLAKEHGVRTLLVDADLTSPQAGVLLNVHGRLSSFDLCSRKLRAPEVLQEIPSPHPSGLDVMLGPASLEDAERLDREHLATVLTDYAAWYEHVIVDMGPTLDELNLGVMDVADQVLLVTTPDVPSISSASRFARVAGQLGYRDKIRLVVNRAGAGVDTESVQTTMGMRASATIASDGKLMLKMINDGQSLFDLDPNRRSQVTRDVGRLVDLVAGRSARQRQRPRLGTALRPSQSSWRLWPRLRKRSPATAI